MARQEVVGLSRGAESFEHLRELDIEHVSFLHNVSLPHTLERIAFRGVNLRGALQQDKCKCAMMAPIGKHDAWQALKPTWPVLQLEPEVKCGAVLQPGRTLLQMLALTGSHGARQAIMCLCFLSYHSVHLCIACVLGESMVHGMAFTRGLAHTFGMLVEWSDVLRPSQGLAGAPFARPHADALYIRPDPAAQSETERAGLRPLRVLARPHLVVGNAGAERYHVAHGTSRGVQSLPGRLQPCSCVLR